MKMRNSRRPCFFQKQFHWQFTKRREIASSQATKSTSLIAIMLTSVSLSGTLLGIQRIKSRLSLYYLNGLASVKGWKFPVLWFLLSRNASLRSYLLHLRHCWCPAPFLLAHSVSLVQLLFASTHAPLSTGRRYGYN